MELGDRWCVLDDRQNPNQSFLDAIKEQDSFLDIKEKYLEVEDGPELLLPDIYEHIEDIEEVGNPQYTLIFSLEKKLLRTKLKMQKRRRTIKTRKLLKQVNLDSQNSSVKKKQKEQMTAFLKETKELGFMVSSSLTAT